jgi:hypothetical protein
VQPNRFRETFAIHLFESHENMVPHMHALNGAHLSARADFSAFLFLFSPARCPYAIARTSAFF